MPGTNKTPHDRFVETALAAAADPTPVVEVGIPMRDGVELAADVYLPTGRRSPRAGDCDNDALRQDRDVRRAREARFYQQNGYAYVAVDVRGRGKSEGEWRAIVNDGPDGHDTIEWVAAQPWCSGKVGTTGLSYMGWTQWATAAERPPHLTCMVSTSAAGRWQQEIPYTNGCFQLYFGWWVYIVRRRITEFHSMAETDWDEVLSRLPLDAIGDFINPSGQTWRDMMDHDTLDDFWRAIRFDDRYHDHRRPLPARHRLVRSGGPARRVPPLRRDDGGLSGAGPAAADRRSLEPRQLAQSTLLLRGGRVSVPRPRWRWMTSTLPGSTTG